MTALLLVHAFPVDASMWDDQVGALGDEVDIVAPSLPGFGGTPAVGDILTMDTAADFVAGELDRAGVERAVVCGLSIGGYVAFSLWRRHRNRIAGLILADTRAEPDDHTGKDRRRAVAEKARTEGSGAIADNPPPLLSDHAAPELWDRIKESIRRQPGEAIAAASLGMAERPDSRPILPEIEVPTAVVVGSEDAITPPPMSEAMAQAMPAADLAVIQGAGHLSNVEAPAEFVTTVRDLLARVS